MRVLVAIAGPEGQDVAAIDLEEGATVADALAAARVAQRHPQACLDLVGVWGRRCDGGTALREGDRVEVYRPVQADAKAMRRVRAGLNPSTRSRSGP